MKMFLKFGATAVPPRITGRPDMRPVKSAKFEFALTDCTETWLNS